MDSSSIRCTYKLKVLELFDIKNMNKYELIYFIYKDKNYMNKEYNYFYKITNLINNRYYFGVHKTNNIEDGYMGSGTRLKYSIKKYGIENFEKEILKYFDKYEDALKYESEIVTEELVNDIDCYNLIKGGVGGWDNENYANVIDKKTNKCVQVLRNSDYYKNKENYNHLTTNKTTVIDKSGNTLMVSIFDERYINGELKSFYKDKIVLKDKNNNIYYVAINDERYLSGELKYHWCNRKHNNHTIEKMRLTHQLNKHQKGEKNSQFGTCWITRDTENKKIKKEELNNYLNEGWIKGRKII